MEMDVVKEEFGKEVSVSSDCKAEERPPSPTDCAICLEQLTDKSFTNSCLHMFCFHCLLAWSKVKPECPLCKQDFCSIIHNIRSMTDYDEYHVPPPSEPRIRINPFLGSAPASFFASDIFPPHRRFFSYRTTLMSHDYSVPQERPTNLVIQPYVNDLEIQNDFSRVNSLNLATSRPNRREVYLKELETRPPATNGRYRECCPEFYRGNEAQLHRLAKWVHRELLALSQIGVPFVHQEVQQLIMDLLKSYNVNSELFYTILNRYLGVHTRRFIREFYNFARSPFDMDYYDRECFYVRQHNGSHLSFIVTVGRDDTEDVQVGYVPSEQLASVDSDFISVYSQVIPSTSVDPPVRPWIDVNDLNSLNTTHYHSSGSGIQISARLSRNTLRPRSTTQSNADMYSHSVIDITDSENDDCVIVDEVNAPETIVLDDSDSGTETVTASTSSGIQCIESLTHPLDLSTSRSSTSQVPESAGSVIHNHSEFDAAYSFCLPELKKSGRRNSEVDSRHNKTKHHRSASVSSILSTDISTEECDRTSTKSKKRKSRKHYQKKIAKWSASSKRKKSSDEDYLFFSSDTISNVSDEDSDWAEENCKSKKRSKKTASADKRVKKTKSKKRKKASGSKITRKKKIAISELSTESNDDEIKRPKVTRTKRKTSAISEVSTESNDDEIKRPKVTRTKRKTSAISELSTESSDDEIKRSKVTRMKRKTCMEQASKPNTLESKVAEITRSNVPKLRSVVKKVNNCGNNRGTSHHNLISAIEYEEDNLPSTSYGYNGYHDNRAYGSHLSRSIFSSDTD